MEDAANQTLHASRVSELLIDSVRVSQLRTARVNSAVRRLANLEAHRLVSVYDDCRVFSWHDRACHQTQSAAISPQARVAEEYAVLFSKLLLIQNRTEVSYRYDGTGDETKYINRLF